MEYQSALRWSWMNVLNAKRVAMLRERFKDLDRAFEHISLELLQALGCREDTAMLAMNRMEEFDPDEYAGILKKKNITLMTSEDEGYPSLLAEIDDRPTFLYARGDLALLSEPSIALVGARDMSDYGKRVTEYLVAPLVAAGLTTVSGLAAGIDSEVARETLRAKGKTIAVLGHGFGTMYPKSNERLAEEIIKGGGLILCEFPLDTQPDKYTFPARNRIIAGLSAGTVVLQAALESGSLITADLALDYNRDVFAVSGSIFDPQYAGCHQIIAKGTAKLVTRAEDILNELGIAHEGVAMQPSLFTPDSPEEGAVWNALSSMPSLLDDLIVKAKLDAATVNATLTMLEIKGSAKNVGSGQWVKA